MQNSFLRLSLYTTKHATPNYGKSHKKSILLDSLMPEFTPLTLTWCNHNFIFLGANPQECEVILGINVSHSAPCLHDKTVHQACILNRCGVVHSTFYRNTCKKPPWGQQWSVTKLQNYLSFGYHHVQLLWPLTLCMCYSCNKATGLGVFFLRLKRT